jgi:hypothetical protein
MQQMHVDELREAAPAVWFPVKVSVVDYDKDSLRQRKKAVGSRTTTIFERVDLDPHHDAIFFRDIDIPPDLGIPVLRPHTFLVRNDWIFGPLADLLVSPWHEKVNKYRLRFFH